MGVIECVNFYWRNKYCVIDWVLKELMVKCIYNVY